MFGLMGTYSDTDSFFYGAFARSYFDNDRQRIVTAIASGRVNNDYEDFLGSGLAVSTTDNVDLGLFRYYKLYKNNWYLGFQLVALNYTINANDAQSEEIINRVGLTSQRSRALGLLANYDTRDNQNSSSSGISFEFDNFAHRKSFGGNESYDVYTLNYAVFISHGKGHVAALHAKGRWTDDAPTGGYSSVELRGYTKGEYLAPHMSLIEIDERIKIKQRWGLTLSAGVAWLYGGKEERIEDNDLFPSAGVGATFTLKPKEKMVIRAEYSVGKSDNSAFYLSLGQPF